MAIEATTARAIQLRTASGRHPDAKGRLLVGFDGRWQSHHRLLDRAAAEAERRGSGLLLVTILRSDREPRTTDGLGDPNEVTESMARRRLLDAQEALRLIYPDLDVETMAVPGPELLAERDALSQASLLVLGARGQGAELAFEPGSISDELLQAVRCAVLVFPDTAPDGYGSPVGREADESQPAGGTAPGFVLVGLTGHEHDGELITAAIQEARLRHCPLHLLHSHGADLAPAAEAFGHVMPAWDLLRGAGLTQQAAPLSFSVTLSSQPADAALISHAPGAALVVVGSRPGSLQGRNHDSVSRALLAGVTTPLLFVPVRGAAETTAP